MFKKQKNKVNVFCPSCKSSLISCIGPIPPNNLFAGKMLKQPLFGGNLYRCNSCSLYFRWPRPSKEKLDALYQSYSLDKCQPPQTKGRKDWQIATKWLNSHLTKRTILDIGCFDGEFLKYLGNGWLRYGIEINEAAARRAEKQGIVMIGKDINRLSQLSQKFWAVVALDLMEHIEDPRHFLQEMLRITLPGGVVIISTGNTSAWTWRFMGSRYWYCSMAGHISFINESWCDRISKEFNAPILDIKKFSHSSKNNFYYFSFDLVKNILYRFAPGIFSWLRTIDLGEIDTRRYPEAKYYPPGWSSAQDHIIVIFQKK